MKSTALVYKSTTFNPVPNPAKSGVWLRVHQIGVALGYTRGDAINKLYANNADEFTQSMTALVKIQTAGGEQEVRVFSLRGAHLLGMFARTAEAKDFRVWILDVLDNEVGNFQPANRLSDKADRVPLKDAVNLLVAKAKNLNYSEAYTMVHQRFNIESVDELTAEQLPAVVEYVHRMIGSWEHAPIALPTPAPQIDPSQLTVHRNHVLHMYQTARQLVREIDMLGMTQEDLPKYLLA
jgi:prophage antirepressor-like protein